MSFDWTEYLRLAQELAGQAKDPSSPEARMRSAVSRAYYAAYCSARNKLGFPIPQGVAGKHAYVWNQFRGSTDRVRRAIGFEGRRLHEDRIKADYHDSVGNLPALTSKAIALSAAILSRLRSIP